MSRPTFYEKFIKTGQKGFSLRGGYHSKWRLPMNRVLYQKRIDAGPEAERPRSIWSNWNYDSEIFALGKRLNEDFNSSLIRQAFINPSYALSQKTKLEELGIEFDATQNNSMLAIDGEKISRLYLKALFKFWYPNLPEEGIEEVTDYLLESERLAEIVKGIGAQDLIKTEEFPVHLNTLETCFYAIVGAIAEGNDITKAHYFINDFVLTQLIGKDINEIWNIKNPMGLLTQEFEKQGNKSPVIPRLLWSTGATHPAGAFIVGLYMDKKFLSKGSGETVEIAEEMAARDALRRIYGTEEEATPLPYGEKARKYSTIINSVYQSLLKNE